MSYNPQTSTLTATQFNGTLFGTANSANNVVIADNNNPATFYIPFCSSIGSSMPLFIDSTTDH